MISYFRLQQVNLNSKTPDEQFSFLLPALQIRSLVWHVTTSIFPLSYRETFATQHMRASVAVPTIQRPRALCPRQGEQGANIYVRRKCNVTQFISAIMNLVLYVWPRAVSPSKLPNPIPKSQTTFIKLSEPHNTGVGKRVPVPSKSTPNQNS